MTPHCLQAWTGESNTADALLSMLQRLPHAEWVVTTLGSRGSAFMQRAEMPADTKPQKVQQLMDSLWAKAESGGGTGSSADAPACTTPDGIQIRSRSMPAPQPC